MLLSFICQLHFCSPLLIGNFTEGKTLAFRKHEVLEKKEWFTFLGLVCSSSSKCNTKRTVCCSSSHREKQPSHNEYVTYLECKIFVQIGTTQEHTSQHKGQSKAHAPAPGPSLSNRHSILRVLQGIREGPSAHCSKGT